MVEIYDSENGTRIYNKNFLKRAKCFYCGDYNKDGDEIWIYRIEFTKKIEKLINETGFEGCKAGYYNSKYVCYNDLSWMFTEYPEIIKKIERMIPK